MSEADPAYFEYPVWMLKYVRPGGASNYLLEPRDAGDSLVILRTQQAAETKADEVKDTLPGTECFPVPVAHPDELAALLRWVENSGLADHFAFAPNDYVGPIGGLVTMCERHFAESTAGR